MIEILTAEVDMGARQSSFSQFLKWSTIATADAVLIHFNQQHYCLSYSKSPDRENETRIIMKYYNFRVIHLPVFYRS